MVIDTLTDSAKQMFKVSPYNSIEARYAASGAGIINTVAATYRPQYDLLNLQE